MNNKVLFAGIAILIVIVTCFCMTSIGGANVTMVGVDHNVTKVISDSGSQALYGLDNNFGAKNKVGTLENGDVYELDGYQILRDGDESDDYVQLIYPNGKQNNADKKSCYVNGVYQDSMYRIYGKDGDQVIQANYLMYLHDEVTVNFVNDIGGRQTSISNIISKDGSWSNNGAMFDNQISGLEFISTDEGNYSFIGWIDDLGNFVDSFSFEYIGDTIINATFRAVYDFIPNPEPEPVDPVDNETDNSTDNSTDNDTVVPVNQNNSTKVSNNDTSVKANETQLQNDENDTVSSTPNNENMVVSKYFILCNEGFVDIAVNNTTVINNGSATAENVVLNNTGNLTFIGDMEPNATYNFTMKGTDKTLNATTTSYDVNLTNNKLTLDKFTKLSTVNKNTDGCIITLLCVMFMLACIVYVSRRE